MKRSAGGGMPDTSGGGGGLTFNSMLKKKKTLNQVKPITSVEVTVEELLSE